MCLAIFTELDPFRSPIFAPLSQLQARLFASGQVLQNLNMNILMIL